VVRSMEAGSQCEDSSHNILTLDALQVLSQVPGNPGLSMSMRIQPIRSLHTYIQADFFGYHQTLKDCTL
jgi:hypothetical protein